MIVKPKAAETEDRLHAAVGSALAAGDRVRAAGKTARRASGKVLLYYFAGMMLFGLIFSGTPIWFKALLGAGIYLLYRLTRQRKRRREDAIGAGRSDHAVVAE